jgi:hypothetical protein
MHGIDPHIIEHGIKMYDGALAYQPKERFFCQGGGQKSFLCTIYISGPIKQMGFLARFNH